MKNDTLVDRLWRDREGATYLEFTIVFPLLVLTAFCTVDFALVMFNWAQANKAVQNGARVAVVAAPVPEGLVDLTYDQVNMGVDCANPATGDDAGVCDPIEAVCIPTAADGDCGDYTFSNDAFEPIFEEMRFTLSTLDLQRENVRISYRTNGLGFVGRPGGPPMEVTVELRCMTHQLFFLGAIAGWAFDHENCPDGTSGVPIPSFATTLISEALGSLVFEEEE